MASNGSLNQIIFKARKVSAFLERLEANWAQFESRNRNRNINGISWIKEYATQLYNSTKESLELEAVRLDNLLDSGKNTNVDETIGFFDQMEFNIHLLGFIPSVKKGDLTQEGFKEAIEFNKVYLVALLLHSPDIDPSTNNNFPIRLSSQKGRTEVVKLLLADPRVDSSAQFNYAIWIASKNGHSEIVKLLLADPRVDQSAKNNEPIWIASINGHTEVVRLLLADPRVDPSAQNNFALKLAKKNGHTEIVNLLLADPRVQANLSSTGGRRVRKTRKMRKQEKCEKQKMRKTKNAKNKKLRKTRKMRKTRKVDRI